MEPFIWYILFLQIFLEWNTEAYIYIYIYIYSEYIVFVIEIHIILLKP